jgi:hypothetical protein
MRAPGPSGPETDDAGERMAPLPRIAPETVNPRLGPLHVLEPLEQGVKVSQKYVDGHGTDVDGKWQTDVDDE